MLFTSWTFAKFICVVFAGLWLLRTRGARQFFILCCSAFFYAYWKPRYLLLLATPSVIDYVCASRIEASRLPAVRKRWLLVSIITNLTLLGYFKYTNFFIDNVAAATGHRIPHLDIVLPVGISFYTFKTLSYTVDVYRREIDACRSVWKYAMFVTFFPELVAGPIVRASIFLPQMTRSLRPSWGRAAIGGQVVLLGLSKKLLVADRLGAFADVVFSHPDVFSPLTVASAVIAYSLQIYCDFSGYSDIAIGISQIIGFDLPENFNMPYLATSVTDFWRRWHMTLSAWLRDYLYIPLGGNRKGRARTYVNLLITMVLGGLWHGASWTFVTWGLLHGVALAGHKLWISRGPRAWRPPAIVSWALTYGFVCLAWIFFRAESFRTAFFMVRKVIGLEPGGVAYLYLPLLIVLPFVIAAHWLGTIAARQEPHPRWADGEFVQRPRWLESLYAGARGPFATRPHPQAGTYVLLPLPTVSGAFVLGLWSLALILFASVNTQPFIYFQF